MTSVRISAVAAAAASRGGEHRAEPLPEVGGERVEGRIPGVQGRGEPVFGRDERRVAVQPARQRLARRVGGAERGAGLGAGIDLVLQHGHDQVRATGEVPIHRPDANAGALGDLPRGRVDPQVAEADLAASSRASTIVHKALDAGINLVDTSDAYGDSEEWWARRSRGAATTSSWRPSSAARSARMLTGRVRKGEQTDVIRASYFKTFSDERRLDTVEQLIALAEQAGLPMTHLALAFAITHPGVTSALLGPRTMAHLDDLLAGLDVALTDDVLDRIDALVPPGTDVGTLDQAYVPPALRTPDLRRRPAGRRAAA